MNLIQFEFYSILSFQSVPYDLHPFALALEKALMDTFLQPFSPLPLPLNRVVSARYPDSNFFSNSLHVLTSILLKGTPCVPNLQKNILDT